MPKNYTVKEKSTSILKQPETSTINSILNFSKSYEVLKGRKKNVELILN